MPSELIERDLRAEAWREYDFGGRTYRITRPQALYMRPNGTTHKVLDEQNVIHCLPAPGYCGCVLRWSNRPGVVPVQF